MIIPNFFTSFLHDNLSNNSVVRICICRLLSVLALVSKYGEEITGASSKVKATSFACKTKEDNKIPSTKLFLTTTKPTYESAKADVNVAREDKYPTKSSHQERCACKPVDRLGCESKLRHQDNP